MGAAALPPKQYRTLLGRAVIEHALAPFLGDPRCQGVVVALNPGDKHFATLALASEPRVTTVEGGAQRRDSVIAALGALARRVPAEDPWVLVHDAVRPCVSAAEIEALLASLADSPDGALLALPLADTVKRAGEDGRVLATLPRERLWRALTPQAFRLSALRAALAAAPAATDEASAIEAQGRAPRLVSGSPANLKLTLPADFELAARILGATPMTVRIGFGSDVHAFGPGGHVMLGGIKVPHSQGVVAHSDGDVLLHALCDALLGAAGLGDIGEHFPDTDARWRGAAGALLLGETLARLRAAGFVPVNADLTLIAAQPKLAPHREAIRARIAEALGLPVGAVNVKATTTEGLGFIGRREGLAAEAAVLIEAAR